MIQEFVTKFDAARELLAAGFRKHPTGYADIVKQVITILYDPDSYRDTPDPARIHLIDDGDYQGTLLFVIASDGYQPSKYWAVKIGYGSCSGCDTFEGIKSYADADEPATDEQVSEYMTLALHVVQGLKLIGGEDE